MSLIRCPHCGARNFTVGGWVDLDHCSDCGKRLAVGKPRPVEVSIPVPAEKASEKVKIEPRGA